MKHIKFTAFMLLLTLSPLWAGNVTVTLSLNAKEVFPMEPILGVVTISNASPDSVSLAGTRISAFKIRYQDDVSWSTVTHYGPVPMSFNPLPPLVIKPGEAIHDFCIICEDRYGNPYFKREGKYSIQCGTAFGESQVETVNVRPIPKQEKAASEFIEANKMYVGFSEIAARDYCLDTKNTETPYSELLNKFNAQYTNSLYSGWMRLSGYWVHKYAGDTSSDYECLTSMANYNFTSNSLFSVLCRIERDSANTGEDSPAEARIADAACLEYYRFRMEEFSKASTKAPVKMEYKSVLPRPEQERE